MADEPSTAATGSMASGDRVSHEARGSCPICADPRPGLVGCVGATEVRRCATCGHRFLAVHTLPASWGDTYEAGYQGFRVDPTFIAAAGRVLAETLWPRWPPPARLLDVGCGNGVFLESAQRAGYDALGVDASQAAVELCRGRGLDARQGDFPRMPLPGRFDVITMWDVVEHLPEPAPFMRRALALLEPGGALIAKVPRHGELSFRLAVRVPRLAGAVLHVPSHIQFFTEATLQRLLRDAGFAWLEPASVSSMRSRPQTSSARKRLARAVVRLIHRASGDGNHFVIAHRDGRRQQAEPGFRP